MSKTSSSEGPCCGAVSKRKSKNTSVELAMRAPKTLNGGLTRQKPELQTAFRSTTQELGMTGHSAPRILAVTGSTLRGAGPGSGHGYGHIAPSLTHTHTHTHKNPSRSGAQPAGCRRPAAAAQGRQGGRVCEAPALPRAHQSVMRRRREGERSAPHSAAPGAAPAGRGAGLASAGGSGATAGGARPSASTAGRPRSAPRIPADRRGKSYRRAGHRLKGGPEHFAAGWGHMACRQPQPRLASPGSEQREFALPPVPSRLWPPPGDGPRAPWRATPRPCGPAALPAGGATSGPAPSPPGTLSRSPGGGALAPGAPRGAPCPAGLPRPWLRAPASGKLGPWRGGGGQRAAGGGKRPEPPLMASPGKPERTRARV